MIEKTEGFLYFPSLFLAPDFAESDLLFGDFAILKRRWKIEFIDILILFLKHNLMLPHQLIEIFLNKCRLEICAKINNYSFETICDRIDVLRSMLYVNGLSPFIIPFSTTYSINHYSGLNARENNMKRQLEGLDEEVLSYITSKTEVIHIAPVEVTLSCHINPEELSLTKDIFSQAVSDTEKWLLLEETHPQLRTARMSLSTAPLIHESGMAYLQIWHGLEALFPSVQNEVTFRSSLLIAQLCSPINQDISTKELFTLSKKSYSIRSKIAHGNSHKIDRENWNNAWKLLLRCFKAILERNRLPEEDELIQELFLS